jgi:SOS-response transcriptional repressor LexA
VILEFSNSVIVVIHETPDMVNLDGKICACQTPDGITLKKVQFDAEKKRVLLRPLNQQYDVIILEEYELETFRILGEMALLFRVV